MLWESHHPLESLPPLPPESRRLVAAFLDANHDIFELANHLEQDVFDLVQQLSDPVVKAWIAAISSLENSARRERALRTLDAALTNSADRPTLRRCASRLLRHFELTRPRASNSCPQNMQPDRHGATYSRCPTSPTLTPTSMPSPPPPTPDLSESSSEGPGLPASISPIVNTTPQNSLQPSHIAKQTSSTDDQIIVGGTGFQPVSLMGFQPMRVDSMPNDGMALSLTTNQRIVNATTHILPHDFPQHGHPPSCLPRAP